MGTKTGKLIVITGPSGVGKGTLIQFLLEAIPELELSISATTRPKRANEVDGLDYLFCNRDQFQTMIDHGEFLEWAEYAGNFYGTPKKPVETALDEGRHIILEIEVQGALQVKEQYANAVLVFIAPPSLETLQERLLGRNTNSQNDIVRRMETARWELEQQSRFRHIIVNDQLEQTQQELQRLVQEIISADPSCSPITT